MKLPTVKALQVPLQAVKRPRWVGFIIPSPEPAATNPTEPNTTWCDADLYGGRPATEWTVSPNYIFVQPQPQLTLDYFLPAQVYGQDPITWLVRPFHSIGVRITNSGYGTATNLQINSGQPQITSNTGGWRCNSFFWAPSVNDAPVAPTLLANLWRGGRQQSSVARLVDDQFSFRDIQI